MADGLSHGAGTGWSMYIIGTAYYANTGVELIDPYWLIFVVIASVIPDVPSEQWIWYSRFKRFRDERDWHWAWQSWREVIRYDQQMTADLETLRKEGWTCMPFYYWCHTVWVCCTAILLAYWYSGPYIASAWLIGYALHLLIDYYMHPEAQPCYPFAWLESKVKTPWWEWPAYQHTVRIAGVKLPTVLLTSGFSSASGIGYLVFLNIYV